MVARCLILALLFNAGLLVAQQAPFVPVSGPGAPEGESALFQDHRGALWLASKDGGREGLTYFDGVRFIQPLTDFPKGLVDEMEEDGEGGLWIPSSAGLYRLFKGSLQKIAAGNWRREILKIAPNVFIVNTAPQAGDAPGKAAMARIAKHPSGWRAETIASFSEPTSFRLDASGTAVLYPCGGLICETPVSAIVSAVPGSVLPISRRSASRLSVYSVTEDRFSCLWLLGGEDPVYQCREDTKPTGLPATGSGLVLQLKDGRAALPGTFLAIGQPGRFQNLTRANGYPGVASSLLAADGSIWLSGSEGLFAFSPSTSMEFWTERDGLNGNTWSVLPTGKQVFAIAGDMVMKLDTQRRTWLPLVAIAGARHLLEWEGTLLVGTTSDGVYQIDENGKILRKSAAGKAWMLAKTPDGKAWTAGIGISEITAGHHELTLHPVPLALNKAPVAREQGTDMKVAPNGFLWASCEAGIACQTNGGWRLLSQRDGLLDDGCMSLTLDQAGDLWCGYRLDRHFSLIREPTALKPLIQHFSNGENMGFGQNNIFDSDRQGRLWRGTEDGLYVADIAQARHGEWLHLNRTDGFPSIDSNQRSFAQAGDGSLWYGAGATITHFFPPADLVHPTHSPSVFVSGFSASGGPFQMAGIFESVEHGVELTAHIGSLQFDRRNALHIRYRLLPEQTAWTFSRTLDIPLGKPSWGTHTLEAQAQLFTGPWSSSVNQSFFVLRPVWFSWPVLLTITAGSGLALTGGFFRRQRRRRRTAVELPALSELRLSVLTPESAGLEGATLDRRFQVKKMLARGGFATVFEGRDLSQDRACALKIFRHELAEQSWMARRFEQEVSALQQIHHPNVVGIYAHGHTPSGAPYLAMELIVGSTLRDLLAAAPLARPSIAGYVRQIGSALRQIHERHICHRDLKPENLMIRRAGAPGADLVLIDFSIAIVQNPDATLHGLSRAAGTLHYMAPEQAIGYADASSDLYSFAKILMEMLTGQPLSALLPDASMDLPARIREWLNQTPLGLSAPSIELVASALEFDPARRPRDAAAFSESIAQDLEKA